MKRLKLICCLIGFMFTAVAGFAQEYWNCNIYDYQYDMTVYLQLQVSETVVTDYSDYEIAAFCEDECRGVATVETVSANGQTVTYGYLRVRSNVAAGENIIFKCYKKSTAEEINVRTASVVFSAQGMIGLPSNPFILELNTVIPEQYKVVFKCEDGTIVKEELVEVGSPIEIPEAPAKEGHTFTGWGDVLSSMPSYDVEYVAQYTVNSYNLVYVVDGEEYATILLEYGASIESLPFPEREGHTFSGWDEIPAAMPAGDVTVTGLFTVNKYAIIYYIGDTEYARDMVEFGQEIVLRNYKPDDDRYSFDGWEGELYETMPARDLEYYAILIDAIQDVKLNCIVDVYTLTGVKIKSAVSMDRLQTELPKGIYIIGGKKYMVK